MNSGAKRSSRRRLKKGLCTHTDDEGGNDNEKEEEEEDREERNQQGTPPAPSHPQHGVIRLPCAQQCKYHQSDRVVLAMRHASRQTKRESPNLCASVFQHNYKNPQCPISDNFSGHAARSRPTYLLRSAVAKRAARQHLNPCTFAGTENSPLKSPLTPKCNNQSTRGGSMVKLRRRFTQKQHHIIPCRRLRAACPPPLPPPPPLPLPPVSPPSPPACPRPRSL